MADLPTSAAPPAPDLIIYVDGASRGNPGPAGGGAVLKDAAGKTMQEIVLPLGKTTNNVAEYSALIAALEQAQIRKAKRIKVFSDSLLMVNQVTGIYRVRHPRILPLWDKIQSLLRPFEWEIVHIPRKANQEADRLANMAAARSEAGEKPSTPVPA